MLRNEANDGLGEMDVEVVANDIPPCVGGGAAQQGVEKRCDGLSGAEMLRGLPLTGGGAQPQTVNSGLGVSMALRQCLPPRSAEWISRLVA
jgi:hypothetical protein